MKLTEKVKQSLSGKERARYKSILRDIADVEKKIKKLRAQEPPKDLKAREKHWDEIEGLEDHLVHLADEEDKYRAWA